ncbi:MAG: PEP-CTERM sorting domain-containing protein [Cytophagales bacterium]|nr:PEP-CTERM sorting domain-containing protein [Armatimonadota bacterium]
MQSFTWGRALCSAGVLLSLAPLSFSAAHAQVTVTNLVAGDNATVQPAGPRTGGNGKVFFNIEGSSNGAFSSYGVLDFNAGTFANVSSINSLNLRLTNAPAGFTRTGPINFYLATNTTASIQPGGGLNFVGTGEGVSSGGQLGTLFSLGSGDFTATGTNFNYSLALTGAAAQTYFASQLGAGGTLRFVITPSTPGVAATFAGVQFNTITSRPSLSFTATQVTTPPVGGAAPEPGTLALVGAALVGGLSVRTARRRRG